MLHVHLSMLNAVQADVSYPRADVAGPDQGIDSRRLNLTCLWTLTQQPNEEALVCVAQYV